MTSLCKLKTDLMKMTTYLIQRGCAPGQYPFQVMTSSAEAGHKAPSPYAYEVKQGQNETYNFQYDRIPRIIIGKHTIKLYQEKNNKIPALSTADSPSLPNACRAPEPIPPHPHPHLIIMACLKVALLSMVGDVTDIHNRDHYISQV